MNKKILHLLIVLIGYVGCICSMYLTWNLFENFNIFLRLLICHVEGTIFIYVLSVLFKNSSWYDAFWSVIPVVLGIFCNVHCVYTPEGVFLAKKTYKKRGGWAFSG